jgi:hypothetical protein
MSCPYFIPTERFDDAGFTHPSRLPLGAAFRGCCGAPGNDGAVPSDEEVKQCNLGYARKCSRLPQEREADAVRFSIVRDRGGQISLCYISELNYLPQENGSLHYEFLTQRWLEMHPDERVQAMAECFLQSYLLRREK